MNNYNFSLLAQSTNKVTSIKPIAFNNSNNRYKSFNYYLRKAINKNSSSIESINDIYCKSDLSYFEPLIYTDTLYVNKINSIYININGR